MIGKAIDKILSWFYRLRLWGTRRAAKQAARDAESCLNRVEESLTKAAESGNSKELDAARLAASEAAEVKDRAESLLKKQSRIRSETEADHYFSLASQACKTIMQVLGEADRDARAAVSSSTKAIEAVRQAEQMLKSADSSEKDKKSAKSSKDKNHTKTAGGSGVGSLGEMGERADLRDAFRLLKEARQEIRQAKVEREVLAPSDKVKELLKSEPLLAKHLAQQAGIGHLPRKPADDQNIVDEIVKKVPDKMLDVLWYAFTQKDYDFNLDVVKGKGDCPYPTNHIEPVQMSKLEQLSSVLPEQLMQDDDRFYADLIQQQLLVMQPQNEERKTLYILIDVSGSMGSWMASGFQRHQWARAIAISLLTKAVKGEANYLVRPFDGHPHALIRATNPDEASQAIASLLGDGFNPQGGTYIWGALECAAKEARAVESESCGTDILLVSDGQDGSVGRPDSVRQLLGKDIRLHVAMIGCESPQLKQVAATYKVFN